MKFLFQIAFENCFQELLIKVQDFVKKYGDYLSPYNSCIQSLSCCYDGDLLYVKAPQTRLEEFGNEMILLTLENILQTPLFFDPNRGESIENVEQYISSELYQTYITKEKSVDPEFHFVFYMSLTDKEVVSNIERLLSQLPKNLPFVVDIIGLPNEVSRLFKRELFDKSDIITMAENLSSLVTIKNNMSLDNEKQNIVINNIYFIQSVNEIHHAQQFSLEKLSKLFGNLMLAFLEGYDHISDQRLKDPITTFGIETFEIDKYSIINNWAINIFKKLCGDVIGNVENEKKVDKDKVDTIFKEILEEEKKGLEQINTLPENQVQSFLKEWKDGFKKIVLDKIIDAKLTNAEKNLLLSYFQNISNRDLIRLEEFDFDKLSLFDSLYIPYIDQTTDKENPYIKLQYTILQIQQLKKDMEKRKQRRDDTYKVIDKNYRRDGRWTDEGYQIGDDIFRIHKEDLIGEIDPNDDLLSEYEADSTKALPHNADLKSYFPPIKNQGSQGACASFSLTSVFEYFLSNEARKYEDMSEAFVYYNARAINGKTNTDNGATLHDVIRGMADKGVCIEELCKYDPSKFAEKPSKEAYEDGETRKVSSAKTVPVNVDIIKSAINEGYPVVGCFKIFKSLQNNTSGYVPMPSEEERNDDDGYHAMVICGYNDKHAHFIVRNSWGTGFGDNGYCYLPYSYVRDNDLTRYAVAITGIDAKEFIKHNPENDDFDFNEQDKNIQYAILINMLKEDEYKLNEDRNKAKELVKELRKLIDEIRSKDDVDTLQKEVDEQTVLLDKKNYEHEKQIEKVSIWDNRLIHVVHGCILLLSLVATSIGIYNEQQMIWVSGIVASLIALLSWITMAVLSKKNAQKSIRQAIESNDQKKTQLLKNIDEKNKLRDKVIQILDAIGDIDSDSRFNSELLNLIISTLNECHKQISNYLKKHYPSQKEDVIVFPEWFGEISKDIKINDFFRRLMTNPEGKDINKILNIIQKEILEKLNSLFDKDINCLYEGGNSPLWKSFVGDVVDSKVYAQIDDVAFNKDPERAKRKQCSYFLSNLDNVANLIVPKTDIKSKSKNRFIFIKVKKVTINELIIFKGINKQ